MRLGYFKVGDKVHERGTHGYSTILFLGSSIAVVFGNDTGEELIWPLSLDVEYYSNADQLGDDLVSAIEDACWVDGDQANLTRPTPHMLSAVENWRNRNV